MDLILIIIIVGDTIQQWCPEEFSVQESNCQFGHVKPPGICNQTVDIPDKPLHNRDIICPF